MSLSVPRNGAFSEVRSSVSKARNVAAAALPETTRSSCPGGAQWTLGLKGGGRKQLQPAYAS